MRNNVLMSGDFAGNYDEKWTKTFDLKFFDFMANFICSFINLDNYLILHLSISVIKKLPPQKLLLWLFLL